MKLINLSLALDIILPLIRILEGLCLNENRLNPPPFHSYFIEGVIAEDPSLVLVNN